ncbi:MAG: RluA family pseudouridine synthase [Myxococcota bacterium]
MTRRRDAVVPDRLGGASLASILAELFGLSAEASRQAIAEGAVFVGGKRQRDPASAVRAEARLVLHELEPSAAPTPAARLVVLFEDESMIVLDKAPGEHLNETETSAHPAIVEQLRPRIPGIRVVHRLDKETSGVVVLAKDAAAAERLSACFRERRAHKLYLAIAEGAPPEGPFEAAITEDPKRPRARKVGRDGQAATTVFTVLGRAQGLSGVRAEPITGRTHQIRVHLAHLGAPIVGDRLYAGPMAVRLGSLVLRVERTLLHAASLRLDLGRGATRSFAAPLPEDFGPFVRAGLLPSAMDSAL